MGESRDSVLIDLKESWDKSKEPRNCSVCGKPMTHMESNSGRSSWVCFDCNITINAPPQSVADLALWSRVLRYFLHGVAFSVLITVLGVFWIFSLVILITIGSFLGLILGFAILFPLVGGMNTLISRFVWGFYMRSSLWDVCLHDLGCQLFSCSQVWFS